MKAVILAAGFGTRMLPITKTIPKELLPVGNKPVIQHTVEALSEVGIKDILIVTSQFKKALEDYFDKNYELEELLKRKNKKKYLDLINIPKELANISFVRQTHALGTGHAILQAEPWVSDDFFMMLNGDDIYSAQSLRNMLKIHKESQKSVMLFTEVSKEEVNKRGIAKIENGHLVGFVEKPTVEDAPSNLANTGCVIYPQKIFKLLKNTKPDSKSGEIYPWDAFQKIMDTDGVLPCSTTERRSIGSMETWLAANNEIAKSGTLF